MTDTDRNLARWTRSWATSDCICSFVQRQLTCSLTHLTIWSCGVFLKYNFYYISLEMVSCLLCPFPLSLSGELTCTQKWSSVLCRLSQRWPVWQQHAGGGRCCHGSISGNWWSAQPERTAYEWGSSGEEEVGEESNESDGAWAGMSSTANKRVIKNQTAKRQKPQKSLMCIYYLIQT